MNGKLSGILVGPLYARVAFLFKSYYTFRNLMQPVEPGVPLKDR